MELSGHLHTQVIPKERAPCTYWLGGLVGLRATQDAVVKKKSLSFHEF